MKKNDMKTLYIILLLVSCSLFSQKNLIENDLYEGNEKVKKEDYLGAEMNYRLALTREPKSPKALFNLGNTQYQANAYDEAAQQFFITQKFSSNKSEKHAALHNMGNVYMKKKEYEKAVESYKSALRNNPSDDETRYNYALAKSLLEKENKEKDNDSNKKNDEKKNDEKKEKGDNKNPSGEDENKGEEKDDKDDKSDKENKDSNQSDDKNNNSSDKSDQNKKRKPGQLSPEQVKSLLDAMNNLENKVQDKINAKKVKGKPIKTKKDW